MVITCDSQCFYCSPLRCTDSWDYRQPFECSNQKQKSTKDAATEASENAEQGADIVENNNRHHGRGGQPISSTSANTRRKRSSPYLGRPLHCESFGSFSKVTFFGRFLVAHSLFFLKGPTKPFPGLWEIPVNPLFNEYNVCPTADQCVFPSSDETDDSDDIVTFLQENFDHHYTTNRAPFQINFHVNWWVHSLIF